MSEEYKIIYKEYEIVYTTNEGIVSIEIKDTETGKIYHSKFKLFKVIKELQQELIKYKERNERAIILTKKIKDDIWGKMAECYEDDDNWNGDFLNIRINSIDKLLEILEDKEKKNDK